MEENFNYEEIFNYDTTVNSLDRSVIMLAMVVFNKNLELTKPTQKDNLNKPEYLIKFKNKNTYINMVLDNSDIDNFLDAKKVLEDSCENFDFDIGYINDDIDILDNAAKFFNGILYKIHLEEMEIKNNTEDNIYEAPQFLKTYLKLRTEYSDFIYENGELSKEEYTTLITARYLMDNVFKEELFFNGYDLLRYIKTTILLIKNIPNIALQKNSLYKFCKELYNNKKS